VGQTLTTHKNTNHDQADSCYSLTCYQG